MASSITIRPVGFNLGGWISQSSLTDGHVRQFIRQSDFQKIAEWGFNSVRLPVDGRWLFENEGKGPLSKKNYEFLEKVLGWAADANLLTVLDLHQVVWHSFAKRELDNLWKSDEDLNSFCDVWAQLAGLLRGFKAPLWFDILNEPTTSDAADWNKVAQRVYTAIRKQDENRVVMVESAYWASVARLEELVEELQGPNLVYSFHFYSPMFVTHQKAPWWHEGKLYLEPVDYPGSVPKVQDYLARDLPPGTRRFLEDEGGQYWNIDALRGLLKPAEKLAKQGYKIYCGEFGVYEKAPRDARLNWTRDVVDLLAESRIGWAYWNYKWLDFGIWPKTHEGNTGPLDEEMLQILKKGIQ
jgi:endoglucanase